MHRLVFIRSVVVILLLGFKVYSQKVEWAHNCQIDFKNYLLDMKADAQGNVYLLEAVSSQFSSELFLRKFDKNGLGQLWRRPLVQLFGTTQWTFQKMTVDGEGNVYILNVLSEPGQVPSSMTRLMKFNPDGFLAKTAFYEGHPMSIALNEQSDLYFCNTKVGQDLAATVELFRIDPSDLSTLWSRKFTGPNNGFAGTYLLPLPEGVLFSARFTQGVLMDGQTIPGTDSLTSFHMQFMPDGNPKKIRVSSETMLLNKVMIDNDLNEYRVISQNTLQVLGSGAFTFTVGSNVSTWTLLKTDLGTGLLKNAVNFSDMGKESLHSMQADRQNRLFTISFLANSIPYQVVVGPLDPLTLAQKEKFQFPGVLKMSAMNEDFVYVLCFYNGTVHLEDFKLELTSGSYLAKIRKSAFTASSKKRDEIQVFPNPGSQEMRVYFNEEDPGTYEIFVYDSFGKQYFSSIGRERVFQLYLNNFQQGIYYLYINRFDKEKVVRKLVVE